VALAAPKFFVRSDERILVELGINSRWLAARVVGTLVFVLLLLAATIVLSLSVRNAAVIAWPIFGILTALLVLVGLPYAWRRKITSEFIVTDETAYTRTGRIVLSVNSMPMDKITDITSHTGVMGRIFGYSHLIVRSAGGGLGYIGISDAYHLMDVIKQARRDFIRRLLEEAGREAPTTPTPQVSKDRCQCPNCAHTFMVTNQRPLDVTCPNCGTQGTLFAEVAA
jgi:membrane protein YdbS with pleckstrin-like domain